MEVVQAERARPVVVERYYLYQASGQCKLFVLRNYDLRAVVAEVGMHHEEVDGLVEAAREGLAVHYGTASALHRP